MPDSSLVFLPVYVSEFAAPLVRLCSLLTRWRQRLFWPWQIRQVKKQPVVVFQSIEIQDPHRLHLANNNDLGFYSRSACISSWRYLWLVKGSKSLEWEKWDPWWQEKRQVEVGGLSWIYLGFFFFFFFYCRESVLYIHVSVYMSLFFFFFCFFFLWCWWLLLFVCDKHNYTLFATAVRLLEMMTRIEAKLKNTTNWI